MATSTPSLRRLALIVLALVVSGLLAVPASAAPPTAADLAADCNDDGQVEVDGKITDSRGVGHLTKSCLVTLTAGSTFRLVAIALTSDPGVGLSAESLQLIASFDEPDEAVVVKDSSLTATGTLGIQVRASDLSGIDGRVMVRNSVINSVDPVEIQTGTTGFTRVTDSDFVGPGFTIVTGDNCRIRRSTPGVVCS